MKAILAPLALALLCLQSGAHAEDPAPANAPAATAACPGPGPCAGAGPGPGQGRDMHHHGMANADGERAGHRCMHKGMMGGPMMPRMIALPSLPPGNAKLEMQMQAEIMQKVGEVIAKYAEQVKDVPPKM